MCKYLISNSKVDSYITNLQGQHLLPPPRSPYITKWCISMQGILVLFSNNYPKIAFREYTSTLNPKCVRPAYLMLVNPCVAGHRNKRVTGELVTRKCLSWLNKSLESMKDRKLHFWSSSNFCTFAVSCGSAVALWALPARGLAAFAMPVLEVVQHRVMRPYTQDFGKEIGSWVADCLQHDGDSRVGCSG